MSAKKVPCSDCPINSPEAQNNVIDAAIIRTFADPEKPNSLRAIAESLPGYIKADHKRVGRRLEKLKKTGAVTQLDKSRGLDGKSRSFAGLGDKANRKANDAYYTPYHAIDSLLAQEPFHGFTLEPAQGDGRIVRRLQAAGWEAFGADLAEGKDFLTQNFGERTINNIVTNPPYSLATKFIRKSLQIATEKVAMLLPLDKLSGIERQELFCNKDFPLKAVYRFPDSVQFDPDEKGNGYMRVGWYVWERGYCGEPVIRWIDEAERHTPLPPWSKRNLHLPKRAANIPERITNVVFGHSSEVMARIAALYFQDGIAVADLTYGKGRFWTRLATTQYKFLPSDNWTWREIEGVAEIDFKATPYEDNSLDAVVLDPPFGRYRFGPYVEAFGVGRTPLTQPQAQELYRVGMTEAHRVLRPGGLMIVKCQDCREGGRNYRTSHTVFDQAESLGMIDEDKFLQLRTGKQMGDPRDHKQKHACKAESYWWIHRKRKPRTPKILG